MCSHFNVKDGRKYATLLSYYALLFQERKNATERQKKICAVYGESAVTYQMCQNWFVRLCAEDFTLHGAPWGGPTGQVHQLKLIAMNLRHSLRIINIIPRGK